MTETGWPCCVIRSNSSIEVTHQEKEFSSVAQRSSVCVLAALAGLARFVRTYFAIGLLATKALIKMSKKWKTYPKYKISIIVSPKIQNIQILKRLIIPKDHRSENEKGFVILIYKTSRSVRLSENRPHHISPNIKSSSSVRLFLLMGEKKSWPMRCMFYSQMNPLTDQGVGRLGSHRIEWTPIILIRSQQNIHIYTQSWYRPNYMRPLTDMHSRALNI